MGFLGFYWRQLVDHPRPLSTSYDLSDKTAIVTGSSVGIGLEVARQFAERKCSRLILAVRDQKRGETAKAKILANLRTNCQIDIWDLDCKSFASLRAFSQRAAGLDRLDLVALSAGLMQATFVKSPTGHELELQVNFYSNALISLLLLSTLQSTAEKTGSPTRLTFTTSEMYEWTSFKQRSAANIFNALDDSTSFHKGSQDHYCVTKLLLNLWTQELASRVDSNQILVNCVNPGFCWSELHRDMDSAGLRAFKKTCAWRAEEGAWCVTDALIAHGGECHGEYLSIQKVVPPNKFVQSKEGQGWRKKIWEQTLEQVEKDAPELAGELRAPNA